MNVPELFDLIRRSHRQDNDEETQREEQEEVDRFTTETTRIYDAIQWGRIHAATLFNEADDDNKRMVALAKKNDMTDISSILTLKLLAVDPMGPDCSFRKQREAKQGMFKLKTTDLWRYILAFLVPRIEDKTQEKQESNTELKEQKKPEELKETNESNTELKELEELKETKKKYITIFHFIPRPTESDDKPSSETPERSTNSTKSNKRPRSPSLTSRADEAEEAEGAEGAEEP